MPIGLVFAWLYRRRAGTLPVVVALAMTLVFAIGPLFGLPLIGRYLRTPAILMALFYGLAVCGWMLLPQGRARRGWLVAGMVALALSVVFLPRHFNMLEGLHNRIERDGRLYADLRDVGTAPPVRADLRGLRVPVGGRPSPDALSALLAGREAGLGADRRERRQPAGADAGGAAGRSTREALLSRELPARHAATRLQQAVHERLLERLLPPRQLHVEQRYRSSFVRASFSTSRNFV